MKNLRLEAIKQAIKLVKHQGQISNKEKAVFDLYEKIYEKISDPVKYYGGVDPFSKDKML